MRKLGLLQFTEGVDGRTLTANARRLESLGYDTLWIPEVFGREPVASCAWLLARTERMRIGTGILNVYVRDAHASAQTANTLAELADGRFTLGLGVSHPVLVEPRGHRFEAPARKMRSYLESLRAVKVDGVPAARPAPVIVAGHGPQLMKVAAELADGLFLYLQPAEKVAQARQVLGPDKEIHAVLRTILCPDRRRARELARAALGFYVQLPAYHRAWQAAGFDHADYANGGSDRLLDTIAPSGDVAALHAVIDRYFAAGASHVSLYPIHPDDDYDPDRAGGLLWDWATLEALAPAG